MANPKMVREIAIVMLQLDLDAPDLVDRKTAVANYDHPASTGSHSGDCTNEAHTCMRCLRDDIDKRATVVAEALHGLGYRAKEENDA